ncbi:MAG: hypothetical protein RLZZ546_1425 [Bacteroidota bacterium]
MELSNKTKKGFALAEVLVAISIFGIFSALFFGFFQTNRNSFEHVNKKDTAVYLAKEGIEATRYIRDQNFSNLTTGTWGLSTSTNKWVLNGSSNDINGFLREIIISNVDSSTKKIESKISYNLSGATTTLSLIGYLTYWQEVYKSIGNWASILRDGFLSFTGGLKVAYSGNYAYVITGTTLRVFDITNPSSPTILPTTYAQTGTLTNIAVSGNYVYMTSTSNTAEVQIRNISNPNSLGANIVVNITGNSDANGVFVSGNYAYITRSSGGQNLVILDISILPTAPTSAGNITIAGENFYESYKNGNYIYVTSSSDTADLRVFNLSALPTVTSFSTINLLGGAGGAVTTDNAGAIAGESNFLYVAQGTTNSTTYFFNISSSSAPTLASQVNLTGGIVNDIYVGNGGQYAWLGTNLPNQELTVLSGSVSPSSLTTLATYNATTSQSYLGVAYHSVLDRLIAVTNYVAQGFIINKPN